MIRALWWRLLDFIDDIEYRLFGAKDAEVIGFGYEPDEKDSPRET